MKCTSLRTVTRQEERREAGQGLVEYGLTLTLVGLLVMAGIALMRPAAAEALADMSQEEPAAPPTLLGGITPAPGSRSAPLAADNFESGGANGGQGWQGGWKSVDDVQIASEAVQGSAFHLEVRKRGAVERQLSPSHSGGNILRFRWMAVGLENNDRFEVLVFDGSWHRVWSIDRYDVDTKYRLAEVNLSQFTIHDGFMLKFQGLSNGSDDRLLIDDVEIAGR